MEFYLMILNLLMYHLHLKSKIVYKENDRPVGLLPHMPTVLERISYKQTDTFMTTNCFAYLCYFRKKP